jgi:mannosyltransferase OCH1-like enzyme
VGNSDRPFSWSSAKIEEKWKEAWVERYRAFCEERLPHHADGNSHQGASGVPKVFHFIWLGSPFPKAKFQYFYESFQRHHPPSNGWQLHLWTDEKVAELRREEELVNAQVFDSAGNFGEKSDILRYEVLYRFGGIYVDVDFECFRPFDDLCGRSDLDFFAGISNTRTVELNNGLIGAAPGHVFLEHIIKGVRSDPMTVIFAMVGGNPMGKHAAFMSTIERTGPGHFTRTIMNSPKTWKNAAQSVVLPTEYFYPVPNHVPSSVSDIAHFISGKTYAAHRWCKSWQQ